ncbi:SMI1/KNR4 family protein [Lewinella sp. 4G2]|uniref:SMI1/KNR4 family protein n=1 Tax=Lewinella sp. 4G2 TaxID=1803372 RepID=UPI0018D2B48F
MAEQELGVDLPELFIDLLKVQNGGYTKGFAYPMTIETSWSKNHIPLYELFGIDLYHGPGNSSNILYSTYMIEEWGLPEKQVLLSGDGHWWITLDYRKSTIPSVNWIDCECSEDIHVANNFTDFIRIDFVYLPTYSPNLNLIERLWHFMRVKILNSTYYEKSSEFKSAIVSFLGGIKLYKEELRSLLTLNFRTVGGTSVHLSQTSS